MPVHTEAAPTAPEVPTDADTADDETEPAGENAPATRGAHHSRVRRVHWSRVLAYGVLPTAAFALAVVAGWAKWVDGSARDADQARIDSVAAARGSTIAMLSYQPDSVEQQLGAARGLLTGDFRDSYSKLTHDVVIPGAKQKHISAVATVPAVASISATPDHAVVLAFVDQTAIIGDSAPTDTASCVRVSLDKVGGRWLVSKFDPI
jgi:Mce-associated membrane protein